MECTCPLYTFGRVDPSGQWVDQLKLSLEQTGIPRFDKQLTKYL